MEAIATGVGERHVSRFAEDEADLVPLLAKCTPGDVARAMAHWRAAAEDADPLPDPDEPDESLHLSEVGGRGVLSGDLAPETTAVLSEALAVADSGDLERTPAQRRAEALGVVGRFFLDHHDDAVHPRRRPRIGIVLTPDQVASGTYGTDLCDAALHRLVVDGRSEILDYGRATRTVSAPLREVLDLRDGHCRFPGCDRPASWCDAHHVTWWERGGTTEPANLVLLCRRHHRRLHRPGYEAKLLPDATFEVTWPGGRVETTTPPGVLPKPFW